MSDSGSSNTRQHPPEKTPENHRLDVRSSVDWTRYTAYRCIHCDEPCVNKVGSDYVWTRECRDCFGIPTLDRHSADDLDNLDAEFPDDEGFVDWYRFGDHDHGEEWVRERTRSHELIEFGDDG